jgi:hypothetical protein
LLMLLVKVVAMAFNLTRRMFAGILFMSTHDKRC